MKKRKDGRYEIKVYLGKNDNLPVYKSVFGKTQTEAKEKAAQLKAEMYCGKRVLNEQDKSFKIWSAAWLHNIKSTETESWYKTLEYRVNIWNEYLGEKPIDKILPMDIDNVLQSIEEINPRIPYKRTSAKTLTEYRSVIIRIFDFCCQNQVLTNNIANYSAKPKRANKGVRSPLSNTEINYIINSKDCELKKYSMISLFAGLRRGEILALRWADIDFNLNVITVDKSLNLALHTEKTTKTPSGIRQVPMPAILADYLKAQKKTSDFVVTCHNKPFTSNGQWDRAWARYIKSISIQNNVDFRTTAHCLRHTFCTLMYESGINELTAARYMGHKDISTTMKIYTHLREENKQKNVSKINAYIDSIF